MTYVYTKDPVVGGSVLVKYVDEAGNTLSDNVVKSGNIGDDYSTEQKAFPGYTFKEVQGSASGQFTDKEQTITYVYTKNSVTPTTSATTTAATTVDVPGTTTGVTPPPAGKKGKTLPKTGEESGLTTSLVGFALMSVAGMAGVLYRKSKKA